jgi:hypothetical protein
MRIFWWYFHFLLICFLFRFWGHALLASVSGVRPSFLVRCFRLGGVLSVFLSCVSFTLLLLFCFFLVNILLLSTQNKKEKRKTLFCKCWWFQYLIIYSQHFILMIDQLWKKSHPCEVQWTLSQMKLIYIQTTANNHGLNGTALLHFHPSPLAPVCYL